MTERSSRQATTCVTHRRRRMAHFVAILPRTKDRRVADLKQAAEGAPSRDRGLTSWKEIAAYLGVSVRTAQRWEANEELPVRRHKHAKLSSPYAYADELVEWRTRRADATGTAVGGRPSRTPPAGGRQSASIAVLPFLSLDRDEQTEIISDGLTEDLTTALCEVANLKVVARTSALYFKNKAVDVRDWGAQLGVETILEGSVRREGKRLRVSAQLIDTADGYHRWSQRFDREIDKLFDLQDELSRAIVRGLRVRLGDSRLRQRRRTQEVKTYNLFLEGRYWWSRRTRQSTEKAIAYYQQAVDREPGFAPAYAGLADCYGFLWIFGGCDWNEAIKKAERLALEALRIDPQSADAHISLGMTRVCQYDMSDAGRAFREALALNPVDVRARHWGAMVAANLGHLDVALDEMYQALDLDPFGMTVNQDAGRILYFARRYDEAIPQLRHTLEIAPQARWARTYLGFAYIQAGKLEDALSVFDADPMLQAFVLGAMGKSDEVRKAISENNAGGLGSTWAALLHLCLSENEKAIESLRRGAETHEVAYLEMCPKVQPLFDPLRSDARFQALPVC